MKKRIAAIRSAAGQSILPKWWGKMSLVLMCVMTVSAFAAALVYADEPEIAAEEQFEASARKTAELCMLGYEELFADMTAINEGVVCSPLSESEKVYTQRNNTVVYSNFCGTSDEVTSLRINESVMAIGRTTDGRWTQVFYGSGMGYVRSGLLDRQPAYGVATIDTTPEMESYAAELLREYIQPEVWERFCADGWTLCLTSEDIEATYYPAPSGRPDTIYGLTVYKSRIIYISARSEVRVDQSLFHEIGHYIYRKLSAEHSEAFNAMYSSYITGEDEYSYGIHCTSSANEFFAESYKKYTQEMNLPAEISDFVETVIRENF